MNYTLTNLAEHLNGVSRDRIKRYLQGVKLTPRLLWEQVQVDLIDPPRGYWTIAAWPRPTVKWMIWSRVRKN